MRKRGNILLPQRWSERQFKVSSLAKFRLFCSVGLFGTALFNVIGLLSWHHRSIVELPKTPYWLLENFTQRNDTNESNARSNSTYTVPNGTSSQAEVLQDLVEQYSTNPKRYVSSCLLIRDDNELLNEWIAYHYHTLKLRYILVAVDPDSVTSPNHIFDRWENLTEVKIVRWSDNDFMPEHFLRNGYAIPLHEINGNATESKWHEGHEDEEQVKKDLQRINNHRYRQLSFLSACYRHMRDRKKSWVIHIDTDEYLTINPVLRKFGKLGRVPVPQDLRPPTVLYRFLMEIRLRPRLKRLVNFPCISLPRLLFGSVVTDTFRTVRHTFQEEKFETLRWKYHTAYNDRGRNGLQKVIFDVSRAPEDDEMFQNKTFSIHRPSLQMCRYVDQMNFFETEHFPLTVNHFLGSWERYNARNDTRRRKFVYDAKAFVKDGRDDWATSWIDGFLNNTDPKIAQELLQDYI